MPDFSDPQRRVLISVDMEDYSGRSNLLQFRAQQDFRQVMDEAAAELAVDRPAWLQQQGGDGELAILPPQASERTLVSKLAPTLDRLLRQYNLGRSADGKIRLRVAVHQGLVHLGGANGYPGEAVITVCRLIDAPVLKNALKHRFPRADVALIISDQMYSEVVCQYQDLRPDLFGKVMAELPEKNFAQPAWIYVPHENAAAGDESHRPRPQDPPRTAPTPTSSQEFHHISTNAPASFGNGNTMNIGDGPQR